MNNPETILCDSFDLENALQLTKEHGYYFAETALSLRYEIALRDEINRLALEEGDHTEAAINKGKPNEVKQLHDRFYVEYGDERTPFANMVIEGLAKRIRLCSQFPELYEWQLSEIGYQRYHKAGFIGIHKDRASDQMLSVTFTISGSAPVEIYRTISDPLDYSEGNVEKINDFITTPGSIMMLRAPGFGTGEQVPHKILQPTVTPRDILNLRMRPTVLEQPTYPT